MKLPCAPWEGVSGEEEFHENCVLYRREYFSACLPPLDILTHALALYEPRADPVRDRLRLPMQRLSNYAT